MLIDIAQTNLHIYFLEDHNYISIKKNLTFTIIQYTCIKHKQQRQYKSLLALYQFSSSNISRQCITTFYQHKKLYTKNEK